ncbi:MAG: hypothetical protein BGO07_03110 [Alphaproteobacteria bacterium 40-19]|nr:MAG: hypothetical protein BGO07_03110 [Alphaproteobacteria bacterium 40-19]
MQDLKSWSLEKLIEFGIQKRGPFRKKIYEHIVSTLRSRYRLSEIEKLILLQAWIGLDFEQTFMLLKKMKGCDPKTMYVLYMGIGNFLLFEKKKEAFQYFEKAVDVAFTYRLKRSLRRLAEWKWGICHRAL